jgi:hypothetical protein
VRALRAGVPEPAHDRRAYGRFYDGTYRPLVSAFHGRLIDAGRFRTSSVPMRRIGPI